MLHKQMHLRQEQNVFRLTVIPQLVCSDVQTQHNQQFNKFIDLSDDASTKSKTGKRRLCGQWYIEFHANSMYYQSLNNHKSYARRVPFRLREWQAKINSWSPGEW